MFNKVTQKVTMTTVKASNPVFQPPEKADMPGLARRLRQSATNTAYLGVAERQERRLTTGAFVAATGAIVSK